MPKMTRGRKVIYQRTPTGAIFCRDDLGNVTTHRRRKDGSIYKDGRKRKKPKLHGRVDFANETRFAGRVRSQQSLALRWRRADKVLRIGDEIWKELPKSPNGTRKRIAHQGMSNDIPAAWTIPDSKGGSKQVKSANDYIEFLRIKKIPTTKAQRWEWCHLIGHSLGGGGGSKNIVAAPAANNSEQMALEHTLNRYGAEHSMHFQFRVEAVKRGTGFDRFLGDVIRYQVRSTNFPNEIYTYYLDCMPRVEKVSSFRFVDVQHNLAHWMNAMLAVVHHVDLSAEDRAAITRD